MLNCVGLTTVDKMRRSWASPRRGQRSNDVLFKEGADEHWMDLQGRQEAETISHGVDAANNWIRTNEAASQFLRLSGEFEASGRVPNQVPWLERRTRSTAPVVLC